MRKPRSKGVYIGITDEQDEQITELQKKGLKLNDILTKGLEPLAEGLKKGL